MTPPTPDTWIARLDPPCDGLQGLVKWLRRAVNAGHASPQDLADARQALELIRGIFERHELAPNDPDGRAERRRKKTGD